MEFVSNPMRQIEIRTTANGGYLVHVGCTYFAYEDKEKLIADLGEYIRDPQKIEEEFNKHHKHESDVPAPRRGGSIAERAFMPEGESEGQAEATDPAEDIPESGY